jgi:hypothetical protein
MAACRDAALFAHERRPGAGAGANDVSVSRADLLRALKPIKASGVREVTVSLPQVGWRDIGGLHDVKAKLRQTVTWAYEHREAYARLGIQPPRGILLYGPPGTGKTLLCAAVAGECHANFITLSIADLLRSEVRRSSTRRACRVCRVVRVVCVTANNQPPPTHQPNRWANRRSGSPRCSARRAKAARASSSSTRSRPSSRTAPTLLRQRKWYQTTKGLDCQHFNFNLWHFIRLRRLPRRRLRLRLL